MLLLAGVTRLLLHHNGAIVALLTISGAASVPDLPDLLLETGVHHSVSVFKQLRVVTLLLSILSIHSIIVVCFIVWILTVPTLIILMMVLV